MRKKNLKRLELNKTNVSYVTNHIHGGAKDSTTVTLTPATIEITTHIVTFLDCKEKSFPRTNCNCTG